MISISSLISDKYVIPILTYHRIDKPVSLDGIHIEYEFEGKQTYYMPPASTFMPQKDFEKQMKFLRKHNYKVISLYEMLDLINNNENLKKTVVITFDDGYEDNYTKAFPILKKYDIPASIFMVASLVGRKGFLSWDQLRELSENNVDICGHTMTHPEDLSKIKDEKRLRYELYDSKKTLEKGLKKNVDFLAYCHHTIPNDKIIKIVEECGYMGACGGSTTYYSNNIYALRRVGVGKISKNLFRIKVSGYSLWIEKSRIGETMRRWSDRILTR